MVMLVAALVGSVNNEISKNREKSKAKYLEIKKKAKRAVYQAKYKKRKIFGKALQKNYQKCYAFKISKKIVKTNQDIIAEECIRNDDVMLTVSDEENKIT